MLGWLGPLVVFSKSVGTVPILRVAQFLGPLRYCYCIDLAFCIYQDTGGGDVPESCMQMDQLFSIPTRTDACNHTVHLGAYR